MVEKKPWEVWECKTLRDNPTARSSEIAKAIGRTTNSVRLKRKEIGAVRNLNGKPLSKSEKLIRVRDRETGVILMPIGTYAMAAKLAYLGENTLRSYASRWSKGCECPPLIVEEVTIPVVVAKEKPHEID